MVTLAAKPQVAQQMQAAHGLAPPLACTLVGIPTCSLLYKSRRKADGALRQRLQELAQARPRFGYRRLWLLLHREDQWVNLKPVLRVYREAGLKLRSKSASGSQAACRCGLSHLRASIKGGQWISSAIA